MVAAAVPRSAAATAPLAVADWPLLSRELAGLLARTGLGDRKAFARLYDLTAPHLFGVVLRVQRDRALAEDLLQEVYVSVWKAAGTFDGARSQPLTWLTSIARNRAIDSLRRAETQPSLRRLEPGADDADGDDAERRLVEAVPDEGPGPLDLLARAGDARELGACLERLAPVQRQSIALAFFDGLSHAEVAAHLRQPLGTVKSWVRRALSTLRACLDRSVARDAAALADEGAVDGATGASAPSGAAPAMPSMGRG